MLSYIFSTRAPRCFGSLGRQTYSANDTLKLIPTKFSLIPLCPWKNLGKGKSQYFLICLYCPKHFSFL